MSDSEVRSSKVTVEHVPVEEKLSEVFDLQERLEVIQQMRRIFEEEIAQMQWSFEMKMAQLHEEFELDMASKEADYLAKLEGQKQRLSGQKEILIFVRTIFGVAFLFSVVMVAGTALGIFDLSDTILALLITWIIAQVVAIYSFITRYYHNDS